YLMQDGTEVSDNAANEMFGITPDYADGDSSTAGVLTLTFAVATDNTDTNITPKSTYKGLPITVEAKNYVTENIDKKPVTKTFKFDFNTDWKLSWTTNGLPDDTTGDVPADALNDEVSSDVTSLTYNVYQLADTGDNSSNGILENGLNFTILGPEPITITSPKNNEKQNGITAAVVNAGGTNTVTFTGYPLKKADAKFTISATNKDTGDKLNLKITFKGNSPKGLATEKPAIGGLSTTTLTNDVPSATATITKGLPLRVDPSDSNTTDQEGLKVYIDASAAKTYGLNAGSKPAYFINGDETTTDAATIQSKLGLSVTFTPTDSTVSKDLITISFDKTGAEYQSYKGLPITVEAANYVTGAKSPVKKSFKINVNPDSVPKIVDSADAEVTADVEYSVETETAIAAGTYVFTASGDLPLTISAPKDKEAQLGITARVNNKVTPPTVTFSGTPTDTGTAKFTMTVENSMTKKKVSRKVTFTVTPKGVTRDTKEKLAVKVDDNDTLDLVISPLDDTPENTDVQFVIAGYPDTVKAEIDASSAKSIFGVGKAIDLGTVPASGDYTATVVSPTGLKFEGETETDDDGPYLTKVKLSWAVSSDVTNLDDVAATAYKSAKLNLTLTRGTGKTKQELKKSFNISMNKSEVPVWHFAPVSNYEVSSADMLTGLGDKIEEKKLIIESTLGTEITVDEDSNHRPIYADGTAIEEVLVSGDDATLKDKKVVQTKLSYLVDLRKPYTITPASTVKTNGLSVSTSVITPTTPIASTGFERVLVTITGTPTKGKETTSKIPLELKYGQSGKSAKLDVTVQTFVKPTYNAPASFNQKNAKEYEVGKAVSIKPKLTINNKLTPKYYVTQADKAILDAAVLTLDEETGEITGAAATVRPTVSNDKYVSTNEITVYAFANGNYPTESGDQTTMPAIEKATGDASGVYLKDDSTKFADASLKVGIKVKPVLPKIKTSKLVYIINSTETEDVAANNSQMIEVSNIDSDLLVKDSAAKDQSGNELNPFAKLTFSAPNLSKLALEITSADTETDEKPLNYKVLTTSGDVKAVKATNVEFTVSNYGIEAKKNISVTVVDPKPVVNSITGPTIKALQNAKATGTASATVTANSRTSSATTLKWKITATDSLSGLTAKIVPAADTASATINFSVNKKHEGGSATFEVTATNTTTKQTSDPVEFTVTVSAWDSTALPEDSTALPEDTTATPEDTTALPEEDVESLLPKDRMLGEGDVTLGKERTADTITDEELRQIEAILGEGYEIAAILPEVT
ncbi:MAG: hypothetical protein IJP96_08465, partial [Synergistaceae bacterium]|nr:hypothetical protein [Synergistaceae bacterium]